MYYRICEYCGAYLDPGESCDCSGYDVKRFWNSSGKTKRPRNKKIPLTVCRPKAGKSDVVLSHVKHGLCDYYTLNHNVLQW